MTKKQKQIMSLFIILTLSLTILVFLYETIGRPYEIRSFELTLLITFICNLILMIPLFKNIRIIMPVVISIHDTVESLHKQKSMLLGLFIALSAVRFLPIQNIFTAILQSLSVPAGMFGILTDYKEDYVKNKPEGL